MYNARMRRYSKRFAGYAFASLMLLFGASSAEASSARFFQQKVADGKAAPAEQAQVVDVRAQRVAGRVPCVDGEAAGYPCKDMDLLALFHRDKMDEEGFPCPSSGDCFSDVWGWTDPVTGVEYALLARHDGAVFFDLSAPENPSFVGMLPTTPGTEPEWWRDIKVVNDHAVIVADGGGSRGHGMQVFDLSQLRDVTDAPATFEPTALYDAVSGAHNVVVNDSTPDIAYIVGAWGAQAPPGFACNYGAPLAVDLSDPAQPTFAGCYNPSPGRGYTHDAQCVRYAGPDTRYAGKDICFSSDEDAVAITDVTDLASPEELGVLEYAASLYTHQGWLTEDHRYFFVNDERDELYARDENDNRLFPFTRTLVFDVQELDDPQFLFAWNGPTPASDHNLYVRGDKMYQANYLAGLRVMDISYDGALTHDDIREVAYFDVYPDSDNFGYTGAWSVYPYFESGIIVVSSMGEGLFVLAPSSWSASATSAESEELPAEAALLGNYPNPFNPETTIRYALPQAGKVRLAVYDLLGQEVAVLVDGSRPAGHHTARFDGDNLPSGSYVYRLQVGEEIVTRAMTLVK